MFHTVFCATAATRSSERLAVLFGATDGTNINRAMCTAKPTMRVGQPSITFGDGDHAMQTARFITDCNKALVL